MLSQYNSQRSPAGSNDDEVFVTGLGPDETVNYKEDLAPQIREKHAGGVDAVLTFSGDADSLATLIVPGGKFVTALGAMPVREGIEHIGVMANPDAATLTQLAQSVAAGNLSVPISESYPLTEAASAIDRFMNGHVTGKIGVAIS